MKTCSKCGIEKEESEFGKGYNQCNLCTKEYLKEYYSKNREKIKESSKTYRSKNVDKIKEIHKEYCSKISDGYVIGLIKLQYDLSTDQIRQIPELIETKRKIIIKTRILKNLTQNENRTITESQ